MQPQPGQIKPEFAPDMRFELEAKIQERPVHIAELMVLPPEDQPINVKIRSSAIRGIPFSAIND